MHSVSVHLRCTSVEAIRKCLNLDSSRSILLSEETDDADVVCQITLVKDSHRKTITLEMNVKSTFQSFTLAMLFYSLLNPNYAWSNNFHSSVGMWNALFYVFH